MVVEQGGVLRSGISVNRNPFLSFESSGNVRRESVLVPSVRCLIFIVDPETVLHPWKLSWAKRKPATDPPPEPTAQQLFSTIICQIREAQEEYSLSPRKRPPNPRILV